MNLTQVEELAKVAAQAELGRLAPARRFVAEASEEQGRAAEKPEEAPRKAEGRMPVAPVAVVSSLGVDAGRAPVAGPVAAAVSVSAAVSVPAAVSVSVSVAAPAPVSAPVSVSVSAPASAPVPPVPSQRLSVPFVPMAELPAWGLSTVTAVTPVGPVLPFRPASQSVAPASQPAPPSTRGESSLTLHQYAALCAELALSPAAAEGIFRRYGLEAQERRASVDAAWKERLRRDPAEYQAWYDLYQRWHAHLAAGGAPPG
jgi:hypothetical protein